MTDGKIFCGHQIEQLIGRLEVYYLVLYENFWVSKFVPRFLGLHDPDEGVRLPRKLLRQRWKWDRVGSFGIRILEQKEQNKKY